jgi:phage terminase small subunit
MARQEWIRFTAELGKLNLIAHLDRGALATYCAAYALWARAMVQIQESWDDCEITERLSDAVVVHRSRKQAG